MRWIASENGVFPRSTDVNPMSFFLPKNAWMRGLRRSQHTAITLWPPWANATARFANVVVLPSAAFVLVTCSVRMGSSMPRNCTDVRSPR
jgi:hypothetical protein